MSLAAYRRKRHLSSTPDPKGKKTGRRQDRLYVMHKHRARNLHYDLRLELDGVLKSWAVPKGPSLDPRDKRLAIQVEDHPIEYGDFEGNIPKGEYGAGTAIIWDRGTWSRWTIRRMACARESSKSSCTAKNFAVCRRWWPACKAVHRGSRNGC
jgi:bifunctional non-homologous end joining protein LigD